MEDKTLQPTENKSESILAALDLGSNSFHMVIARIVQDNLQILSRHKEKVRQGAGLGNDGLLDADAIERGLASLVRFNERLQPFETAQVRIVGTHTLRVARNAREFLDRAEQILSHPIEIISGHEEARLIYKAVAHSEQTLENTLVIDIGGGSTELIIGRQFTPLALTSRSMGCVSYTSRFFSSGITKSAFKKAILAASQEIEPIINRYRKVGWQQVLATSGTAAALATCATTMGFAAISAASLQALQQLLIEQDGALAFSDIQEDRLQVLAGGLAVMQAIVKDLHIESIHYSAAALREGVLYEMHGGSEHENVRLRSRESLQARYNVDLKQAEQVADAARWLWHQLKDDWQLPHTSLSLLLHAAHLHEIGLDIHSTGVHKHSAYIMANTDLPGFNQEEQQILANLVRFHRKKLNLQYLLPVDHKVKEKEVIYLIRILRIAVLLNMGRHGYLCPTAVKAKDTLMTLTFEANLLAEQQLLYADLEAEMAYLAAEKLTLQVE